MRLWANARDYKQLRIADFINNSGGIFMLVYSFDKKAIADVSCLIVERNVGGGKDGKFVIRGYRNSIGEGVVCSRFDNEEDAIRELENAFKAFSDKSAYYIF